MLFHNPNFLFIFLPIVFVIYFFLKDKKKRIFFLSLSGFIFYAVWNLKFAPLIIGSIITNYLLGKKIILTNDAPKKKSILLLAIFFNIFYLAFFKYSDFFISNYNIVFNTNVELLNFPFPLALSFVTFQTIGFIYDCYEKNIKTLNLNKYSLFIIFFPQLIAGPIVKYHSMTSQFESDRKSIMNIKNVIIGLIVLSIGIIKKVFIADNLSIISDQVFAAPESLNFITSWIGSLCFTFQIYFDFSGYIDMATGVALLFNIYLPQNFNSPYKATGIIDFWQRWHITLTNFLTTYIYTPLLKSFKNLNFFKSMVSTMLVFLIAGLWHGPSWLFVIFGALHGAGLITNHVFRRFFSLSLNKFFSQVITFLYVNFTFIFFRSESISNSLYIIKKMFMFDSFNPLGGISIEFTFYSIIAFIVSIFICFLFKNTNWLIKKLEVSNILN
jgi:alginate O-acetyltransferase complex protein AlgI